ncbi:unnamed protein product [Gemmataceae bacterium]|nr:unnamed protein product [Gemmataceae bacterium]VTT97830.1 unnamed protein product [Gemmataceae bacterium]
MDEYPKKPGTEKGGDNDPPASPYGPHPNGVDEAAGGADSSPFENESSTDRKAAAESEPQNRTRQPRGATG